MNEHATSPVATQQAPIAPAANIFAEWRRFGAFLKRPSLDQAGNSASPVKLAVRIYALDMVLMSALLSLVGILVALGIDIPRTAIADMEITAGLALFVVFGAPVLEEIAFRSWLTGRRGWLLFALAAGGLVAVSGALIAIVEGSASLGTQTAIGGGAAIFCVAFAFLRKPQWFRVLFPALFWLSASGFALIHLGNFSEGNWWAILPLVLPQLMLGTLAGYLRVQVGLLAAIALHAVHNATALGIATLAMGAG